MTLLAGLYRATVLDNANPAGRRRLRVSVPDVAGAANLWAEACVPCGSRAMPQAGSAVWVQFERGDPARPVWIGVRPSG